MTRGTWARRIRQACEDAGTYEEWYEDAIETLAQILENRDKAQKKFKEMGGSPVIERTNQRGITNTVKNPALVIINEMNAQALAFWRELGLTPKGFQAMQKAGLQKKETSFEDLLANIGI